MVIFSTRLINQDGRHDVISDFSFSVTSSLTTINIESSLEYVIQKQKQITFVMKHFPIKRQLPVSVRGQSSNVQFSESNFEKLLLNNQKAQGSGVWSTACWDRGLPSLFI